MMKMYRSAAREKQGSRQEKSPSEQATALLQGRTWFSKGRFRLTAADPVFRAQSQPPPESAFLIDHATDRQEPARQNDISCNAWRKDPLRPRFSGCSYGHSTQKQDQTGLISHAFRSVAFCRAGS